MARLCVFQGLLLQYCSELGPDGVSRFFQKVTKSPEGLKMFSDDVERTYAHVQKRSKIFYLKEQKSKDPQEMIQLEASEPGTTLEVDLPAQDATDLESLERKKMFDSLQQKSRKH